MARSLTVLLALAASAGAARSARAQSGPPDAGPDGAPPAGLVDPFAPPAPPAPPAPAPPVPTVAPPVPTVAPPVPTAAPARARRAPRRGRSPRRRPAYPRELAARPLLLPAGVEGEAALIAGRTRTDASVVDERQLALRARFRAGPVEAEVGAVLFLARDPAPLVEPNEVQLIAAVVRYRISPDHSLGLGGEAHADRDLLIVAARYQRKLHLAPRAALETGGALAWINNGGFIIPSLARRTVTVGAEVRAIAQLDCRIAVDAHASYGYQRGLIDHPLAWTTRAVAGVGATVSITRSIDARAALDVAETGLVRYGTVTVAVALRSFH